MPQKQNQFTIFGLVRWLSIIAFLIVTIYCSFIKDGVMLKIAPLMFVTSLFLAIWLTGIVRYGFKNLFVFFLITWLVSNFFESLSIQTGFPFGYYFYNNLIGPRFADVPIIIMFAYFSAGYASWILAHIILQQFHYVLRGKEIFFVPFIATFIMVIWDLCMDPLESTLSLLWIWHTKGPYFGVPISNYFGWFLVVYIIFQLFALYLTRFDNNKRNLAIFVKKCYWEETIYIYGILALSQILNPFTHSDNYELFASLALITVFTMGFLTILAYVILRLSNLGQDKRLTRTIN